ncbi:MAG TPA: DUF6603 domain-containing protein, partial [Nitrospiraceae bacterium]|nr:DUF6603 domain-containing protein [Nitrospiraceae bacterium]
MANPLGSVARVLFEALSSLREILVNPNEFVQVLRDLGWNAEVSEEALAGLDAASTISALIQSGEALVESLGRGVDDEATVTELLTVTQEILTAIASLKLVDGSSLDPTLANSKLWDDLASAIPDLLFIDYIEEQLPALYGALRILGVIQDVSTDLGTVRQKLEWSTLAEAAANPIVHICDRYGWNDEGGFHYSDLQSELELVAQALTVRVSESSVREEIASRFFGSEAAAGGVVETSFPIVSSYVNGAFVELGWLLVPVPSTLNGEIDGLYLTNLAFGSLPNPITLTESWSLSVYGHLEGTGSAGIRWHPDSVFLEDPPPDGAVKISVMGAPSSPWTFFDGLVEVGGVELSVVIEGTEAEPQLTLSATTTGAAFVLAPADGDSFLCSLLGNDSMRLSADLSLSWSSKSGLTLSGMSGLEVSLPLNICLGIVTIDDLHIELKGEDGKTRLQVDIAATGALGPIVASVEGFGTAIDLVPEPSGETAGSLGTLDVAFEFVPPTGLGLALDTGVVSGGGYLSFDAGEQSYAGIMELGFLNLDLQAYGLVTTNLPDGSDGWSMVIFISTSFAPIPIGFGFFLEAVGGMFGYNRSVDADVLQAGIREGTLDSLLFPDNPVANAVEILSDLEAVFPATEGQYLFGPMAEIGWPSPSILDVDLAIILEAPDPARVLVLGQIAAQIPSQEPIIELHVDVVGVLDLDQGTLSIDASLYDSSVALYSLNG